MNEESNQAIVHQFLATSQHYLTTKPIAEQQPHEQRSAHALTRSSPLQRPIDRRVLQDNVIWSFAARHRFP